ncbi:hypothetical protein RHSIM_Rhsim03G0065800 [Rhododendron simsii]|uniref:DUF7138 domain-containing protein n=1 Tax=Rhododendron simsii TaxID=118357 RepID=A0A834HBX4_RHOSS|nr:hypothetical protein RHSIM_Rhsim03G0065800 [Rhododendron simsii]
MMEDGGAVFPVVFSDGERETNVGSIKIHPSTEFKNFQETLCGRIGVSPNQITIYLTDDRLKNDGRRRIPIAGRADFALVAAREKKTGCSFLVVLRRSRRRSRPRQQQQQQGIGFRYGDVLAPENYRLLRRDRPDLNDARVYDQVAALRYRDLEMQRENYTRMMMVNVGLDPGRVSGDGFRVSSAGAGRGPFCEECAKARVEGRTAPFHCCVFDDVVVGFRSKAGPVAWPRKAGKYY